MYGSAHNIVIRKRIGVSSRRQELCIGAQTDKTFCDFFLLCAQPDKTCDFFIGYVRDRTEGPGTEVDICLTTLEAQNLGAVTQASAAAVIKPHALMPFGIP
jgi:hypothetical protein